MVRTARLAARALLLLVVLGAAGRALAWLLRRRLLCSPERAERDAAEARASRLGLEPWTTPSGALLGWRLRTHACAGPKRMWVDPDATHNAAGWRPALGRWRELVEFLAGAR